MTDRQLLDHFLIGDVAARQQAFTGLVQRHVHWIYAAAVRQIGDAHAAEDVVQATFIVLAKKARTFPHDIRLTPWLARVAQLAALRVKRDVARRRHHETQVHMNTPTNDAKSAADAATWNEIAPLLDAAVGRLREEDREAILLRFYRQLSFADVGKSLGISEEAARKRVSRAVKTLRPILTKSGAASALSVVAIAELLTTHTTASAAPAGLVGTTATIGLSAATGGAVAGSAGVTAKGIMTLMTVTKIKIAAGILLAAIFVGGVGVAVVRHFVQSEQSDSSPPAVQPREFASTLSDGTKPQIVALGDPVLDTWWLPDGTPIAKPAFAPKSSAYDLPHKTGRRYVWLIDTCTRNGKDFGQYTGQMSDDVNTPYAVGLPEGEQSYRSVLMEMDSARATVNATLRVLSEPPTQIAFSADPAGRWDPAAVVRKNVPHLGEVVMWSPRDEPGDKLLGQSQSPGAAISAYIPDVPDPDRIPQFIFTKSDGNHEINLSYSLGDVFHPMVHARCVTPLAQLKSIGMEFNFYRESVLFQNISLQPGKSTEVKITAHEPTEPVRATLKNGVSAELLGVGMHPSTATSWWRADGSPLVAPPYAKFGGRSVAGPVDPGGAAREFAFRTSPLIRASVSSKPFQTASRP